MVERVAFASPLCPRTGDPAAGIVDHHSMRIRNAERADGVFRVVAGDDGWIHADPNTLATGFDGVYAIGDTNQILLANGKPLPRAGVFAHSQAHTVADTIIAAIAGKPSAARFDGHGGCFIETGSGRAAYGTGNFYADPAPAVTLHHPARRWHWSKVAFEQQVIRRWL